MSYCTENTTLTTPLEDSPPYTTHELSWTLLKTEKATGPEKQSDSEQNKLRLVERELEGKFS